MDPGTAGTVGFLLRLVTMSVAVLLALRIAGLGPRTLALGGAFTAVVVGLAAQHTLGNLFAGMVPLSARPFRVGERVRLQGGGLAGTVEGVVSSLGLLYTTLASGDDSIMVPNSVVLDVAIVPLREPEGIDLRARLRPGLTPLDVQEMLQREIETPMRESPGIELEEVDGDEVVVRISATPERPADGPRLASEVLEVVGGQTARAPD
jgi:small conductance mechanosensitive channel